MIYAVAARALRAGFLLIRVLYAVLGNEVLNLSFGIDVGMLIWLYECFCSPCFYCCFYHWDGSL